MKILAIFALLLNGVAFANPIEVRKLNENVHLLLGNFTTQFTNKILIVGSDETVLIDGDDITADYEQLRQTIATITDKPVRFLVNSHWHHDHTGLNERFTNDGATVIAHMHVRKFISKPQKLDDLGDQGNFPALPPEALPAVSMKDGVSLHLNGEKIDLIHYSKSHSDSDIVTRLREANVVHLGDLYFGGMFPVIDRMSGGSIETLIKTLHKIDRLIDEQTVVVPAHGAVGDRQSLRVYIQMLETAQKRIRSLIKQGLSEEQVVAQRPLAEFDSLTWFFMSTDLFTKIVYRSLTQ